MGDNNKLVDLDLTTVDGNAFAIMGAFSRAATRQGWSKEEVDEVIQEAQSGDYDNLLAVIMSNCK